MLNLEDDIYLSGYWQSPKYFEPISNFLRDELRVTSKLSGQNKKMANTIDNTEHNAIGVHIRRGDFVDLGTTLPAKYYDNASKWIESKVDNPVYFVFSDDPRWAKRNIGFDRQTIYATHNDGKTDYEDLRLLRRCDHQITANSTFSWWGAWLNENNEKIIVTPYSETDRTDFDFIPDEWFSVSY
jgi:hypothetical protein